MLNDIMLFVFHLAFGATFPVILLIYIVFRCRSNGIEVTHALKLGGNMAFVLVIICGLILAGMLHLRLLVLPSSQIHSPQVYAIFVAILLMLWSVASAVAAGRLKRGTSSEEKVSGKNGT